MIITEKIINFSSVNVLIQKKEEPLIFNRTLVLIYRIAEYKLDLKIESFSGMLLE